MKTIKASELKPLQKFTMSGKKHVTVDRHGVCGFMSVPSNVVGFTDDGKVRFGEFRLLRDADMLAVDLGTGSLCGISGDADVEVSDV